MSGYTTGSDNAMTSDGTYDYQHDADGNVISRTRIASTYSTQYLTTYTWDYRNRLTDVYYHDNNGVLTGDVRKVLVGRLRAAGRGRVARHCGESCEELGSRCLKQGKCRIAWKFI